MRRRRDPFARVTYIPVVNTHYPNASPTCIECGTRAQRRHPLYLIRIESDDGSRSNEMTAGVFCSWSCAEAFHDARIGR
jgi:hypothetical protein